MRDWLAGTLLLSALMLVGANGQQQQEKKDDFTKALDEARFELHRSVAISSQALASIDLSKLSVEELHIYLGRTSAKESEFMSGLSQARGQLQSSVGQFKSRLRNALTARSVEAKAAAPGAQAEAIRKHPSAGASEL